MTRKDLLFLLFVIAIVGILHIVAESLYLYSRVAYYDRIVHFLAGFWVGSLLLFTSRSYIRTASTRQALVWLVSVSFAVGVVWELFELLGGMTHFYDPGYIFNTIGDLVMDVMGTLAAWFYIVSNRKPKIS